MKIKQVVPCKPRAIWTLISRCEDSQYIGDILRAFAGQDVDLDFGQRYVLDQIIDDAGAMETATEERRKNWRKSKQIMRKSAAVIPEQASEPTGNETMGDDIVECPQMSLGHDTCPEDNKMSSQTDRRTDRQTDRRTDGRTSLHRT